MALFSHILMFENAIYAVNVLPSRYSRIGLSLDLVPQNCLDQKSLLHWIFLTFFYVHLGISIQLVFFAISQNKKKCGNIASDKLTDENVC